MILLFPLLLSQDPVDELIEQLSDDSVEVREEAMRRLVEMGTGILPKLDRDWRDPDVRERVERIRQAVKELAPWHEARALIRRRLDEESAKDVIDAIESGHPDRGLKDLIAASRGKRGLSKTELVTVMRALLDKVPETIIEWAVETKSRELLPAIRILVRDGNADARIEALAALAKLGSAEDADLIAGQLSGRRSIALAAARALIHMEDQKHFASVLRLCKNGHALLEISSLVKAKEDVYSAAIERYLVGSDSKLVRRALDVLELSGLIEGREDQVVRLLRHEDKDVHLMAFMILRELPPETIAPLLPPVLKAPEPKARGHALHLLKFYRQRGLADEIAALLDDPDPEVRRAAVKVLGSLEVTDHADAVAKQFNGPLRHNVIKALGRMGAVEHADLIASVLTDEQLRLKAATALAQMGDRRCLDVAREILSPEAKEVSRKAVPLLVALNRLRDPETWKKFHGLDARLKNRGGSGRKVLARLCQDAGAPCEPFKGKLNVDQYGFRYDLPVPALDVLEELAGRKSVVIFDGGKVRLLPQEAGLLDWREWLDKETGDK